MKPYIMTYNGITTEIGNHMSQWGAFLYAKSMFPNSQRGSLVVKEDKRFADLPEFLKPQA